MPPAEKEITGNAALGRTHVFVVVAISFATLIFWLIVITSTRRHLHPEVPRRDRGQH